MGAALKRNLRPNAFLKQLNTKGGLLPDHPIMNYKFYRCPFLLHSRKVEAAKVHHLSPCRHKIFHKLCFAVGTSIHFG